MNDPPRRQVAITLRLYRALASAFPYEFKNVYGEELLQITEDAIEPIWRRHGVFGLARLLLDIAIRIPAEYLSEIRLDARYGLRRLAASPGFTAVALISLSLGICVAVCAFSELNGLILRNIPGVPEPGELVALKAPSSYPQYRQYRELKDIFSSTFAFVAPVPFGISLGGQTQRTWGHLVTSSYFSTLGVHPALGRFFSEARGKAGVPEVVVSYRWWQSRLGSDPAAIGRTLRINGQPCTVIGIGPKDFLGASPMFFAADVWLPVSVGGRVAPEVAGDALERRDLAMFLVVGRLKPGVGMERAEAALDTTARQLEQAYGERERRDKARRVLLLEGGRLVPIRKQDLPFFTAFFTILAGLVILIACANVTNMTLARAADRRREIAVRLALGAGRARLVRQLLTESMLVSAGAGVVGTLFSMWIMRGASRVTIPVPIPATYDLTPDGRAVVFTLVLIVLTGVALGLVPALQATGPDLTPALKEGGNVRFRRYRRMSLRNVLMVSQMAGSLMLLLLTAFLVIGVQRALGLELGFNGANLYMTSLDPIRDGYSAERAAAFFPKLLERVKRIPSVTAASLTDTVPVVMNGNGWVPLSAEGEGRSRVIQGAVKNVVGKDYFETLGIPIVAGRGFREQDERDDAPAVIVSEKLARALWKSTDPVGRRIETGRYESDPYPGGIYLGPFDYRLGFLGKGRSVFEVVGVARDTKVDLMMGQVPPVIYFPLRPCDYARPSVQGVTLMVRTAPGADAMRAVRREISTMAANITPFNASTIQEQVQRFVFLFQVVTSTYVVIGVIGLILASVGLAGVTAYSVARRGREIAIRIAMGARGTDVLGLVMKEGAVLCAIGTAVGFAGVWAGTRALSAVESAAARAIVTTSDPVLLVGAPLLLAGLALVACYVPARRSTRIDPVVTLRME